MSCTYKTFYKDKPPYKVLAETSLEAQQMGARHFKAKKSYDVSVQLIERADGTEVPLDTAGL